MRNIITILALLLVLTGCITNEKPNNAKEGINTTVVKTEEPTTNKTSTPTQQGNTSKKPDLPNAFEYKPTDFIVGLDGVRFGGITVSHQKPPSLTFIIDNAPYNFYLDDLDGHYVNYDYKPIKVNGKTLIILDFDIKENSVMLTVKD